MSNISEHKLRLMEASGDPLENRQAQTVRAWRERDLLWCAVICDLLLIQDIAAVMTRLNELRTD